MNHRPVMTCSKGPLDPFSRGTKWGVYLFYLGVTVVLALMMM
jgi:hypothetical protein